MTPLYLGWQYATPTTDPGPPPLRPAALGRPSPPGQGRPSPEWLAAQRREENRGARPRRVTAGAATVTALALATGSATGWVPVVLAVPVIVACLVAAVISGHGIWRGERVLRRRIDAERLRAER